MAQYVGVARLGRHQSTTYTTAAAGSLSAVSATKIRVVSTTDAFIRTDGTTATTADVYLPALSPEYFSVTPGQLVSAIGVGAAGQIHTTECP